MKEGRRDDDVRWERGEGDGGGEEGEGNCLSVG